jgi:hypothetical protein
MPLLPPVMTCDRLNHGSLKILSSNTCKVSHLNIILLDGNRRFVRRSNIGIFTLCTRCSLDKRSDGNQIISIFQRLNQYTCHSVTYTQVIPLQ